MHPRAHSKAEDPGSSDRSATATLAAIIDSATDAVLSKDLSGIIQTWNAAAERLYGYTAAEAVGRPVGMLLPGDRRDEVNLLIARLLEGEQLEAIETTRVTKSGALVEVSLSISAIKDEHGTIVGAATIARDITHRRQAEAQMRQFAAIVDAAFDAMYSTGIDGLMLTWNAAAERLFGYSAEEMIGSPSTRLIGTSDLSPELAAARAAWRSGRALKPFEIPMLRQDGTEVQVAASVSPITDAAGRVVAGAVVVRDLTEQRLLEAQLRQVHRMEAIGRLASGVAHDFNNALSIIQSATTVLAHEIGDRPSQDLLEEIEQATAHAANLTSQLLAFGRQQVLRPEPTDLNTAVNDTLQLARRLLSQRITVEQHLAPDLPEIEIDRTQLQQIILNLTGNAGEAMTEGGTLTVRTDKAQLSAGDPHLEVNPGTYALLEIADSGIGIDAEAREHIFDPFFTTKMSGHGLGLATVYGIVKQSGGHLAVTSALGQGTAFSIYLPFSTG